MKTKFTLFFSLFFSFLFSQKIEESIESKKLQTTREFTIILPKSYEFETEKKYPILVLLDGEYLTDPFVGTVNFGNYWDELPDMIILSIKQNYGETRYNDSEYDYQGLPSDKGGAFFEFIGGELLPYVEKKYRVHPFRIIAGHDSTAGFLNFFLYKDNPIFDAYISMAPEMAPGMPLRISERLRAIKDKNIFYYQAISMEDLDDIKENALALDANVRSISNRTFEYYFDKFENATHYSVVAQAIPHALYFIFDGFEPISMKEFQEKIILMQTGQTQFLIDKYEKLDKKFGISIRPRLTDFKAIEASILKNKSYPELQELSKYAEKHYPKTTLPIYHQALYYEKVGEIKKAVKEYRRSFVKDEIKEIRELTKDYMITRSEDLKYKEDDSKVEDFADPETKEEEKKEEGEE